MRQANIYNLYDMDGQHQFTGTAAECAEYLGISKSHFKNRYYNYRKCKKYTIERQYEDAEVKAIMAWDELVTPLREKFGIPVYKTPEEEVQNG